MYLSDYDPGLGSLRKKLRKVGKIAAHVGAAFATGGASLAVSAAMINAKKQQKAAQAAAAAQAAQEKAMIAQLTAPPPIAAPASPPSVKTGGDITTTSVPSTEPMPTFSATAAKPAWMTPAMIAGGVALVLLLMPRRSS